MKYWIYNLIGIAICFGLGVFFLSLFIQGLS